MFFPGGNQNEALALQQALVIMATPIDPATNQPIDRAGPEAAFRSTMGFVLDNRRF